MKILVAEENRRLLTAISFYFSKRSFTVDSATNSRMLIELLKQTHYDAIVIDCALENSTGIFAFKAQVDSPNRHTPCIVISSTDDLSTRVAMLNAGADDYLSKPFELMELEARIFALLRRPHFSTSHTLSHGDICFDLKNQCIRIGDNSFILSRREGMLLAEILRAAPGLITKTQLENRLYSFDENVGPNAIEALVSRVRRKLLDTGTACRIETARGLGYRLAFD